MAENEKLPDRAGLTDDQFFGEFRDETLDTDPDEERVRQFNGDVRDKLHEALDEFLAAVLVRCPSLDDGSWAELSFEGGVTCDGCLIFSVKETHRTGTI